MQEPQSIQSNPLANGMPVAKRPRKPLPAPIERGITSPLATSVEVQRAFFTTADKLLRNSSIAYRLNPLYQQMMRADADVEGVLRSLQVTLASLEWSISSTDKANQASNEIAKKISQIFREMPRRSDFIRAMHEAIWYGNSACNIVYERNERTGVGVKEWYPFHPDTLAYDQRGNLAMRVGAQYGADGPSQQNIGFDSRVHLFTEEERKAVVLHRVFVNAPDFNDPNSSESIYRGVGARDVCWFMWMAKQEILQDAITYADRYAMGIRVGRYPLGQDEGRAMMEQVLSNLTNDNSVLLPMSGMDKLYDIEIMEAGGGQAAIFLELVNWFSGKIKESIVGQNLSSESAATGLGSGVASLHADTLSRIIRYHADALSDSLTTDFVRIVARMLGATPEQAANITFEFAPERPDPKERLEAVKSFVELGGKVSEREVRDLLGLAEPEADEPTLGGARLDSSSDLVSPQDQINQWLQKSPVPATEQGDIKDEPRAFSRRSWW